MTPDQAAARLGRIANALERELLQAEADTLREAKRLFVTRSSGTTKTAQLRAMGHPFAARDPQTPLDPSLINDQGGGFNKRWQIAAPRLAGRVVRSSIVNTDPIAKYMLGTKLMVARPIAKYVADRIQVIRMRRLRTAVRRAIRAK